MSKNIFDDNMAKLNSVSQSEEQKIINPQEGDNRNKVNYYQSSFPQLTIVGYGVVNTVGGTTAVFDELAATPITEVKHQPDYSSTGAWTISRSAAGIYVLTHNLGHEKYIPTLTNIQPGVNGENPISVINSNTLVIGFTDAISGAFADPLGFSFIIHAVPA